MSWADETPIDPLRNPLTRGNGEGREEGDQAEAPEPQLALAAYGTLAPGQSNYSVVAGIAGDWHRGTIRGHRWTWTRGPYEGLPALRLDPAGAEIPVSVLVSAELPAHWHRIDAFEGEGYRRLVTAVTLEQPPASDNDPTADPRTTSDRAGNHRESEATSDPVATRDPGVDQPGRSLMACVYEAINDPDGYDEPRPD